MNKRIRNTVIVLFFALAALFLTACGEQTPYDEYDRQDFTVSVKYDANGGMFTTNVETIVDTYNLTTIKGSSKTHVALLAPDDERRGSGDAYSASNAGYFLAGWYTERTAVTNSEGEALDEDGNVAAESGKAPAYTYSGRWDFSKDRLEIDTSKEYTAAEPVVTLYAAWLPEFKFEFYSLTTGELLDSYTFNPDYVSEIDLPQWNTETGTLDMEKFPTVSDMTLNKIYLDSEKTLPVDGERLAHTGTYDAETASATNPVMKLYLEYMDGEWYRIYTAEQFIDNASVRGCYEIMADLDFTEETWKTSLLHGSFRGKIVGNGHKFMNIKVEQTDTKKNYTGLFGYITADAVIENVTFDNVTLTIANGTLQQDASFGLLAGALDAAATLSGVSVQNSTLQISSSAYLTEGNSIGLLCGEGSVGEIDLSGITCKAVGDNAEGVTITVDGNEVTVTIAE